MSTTNHYLRITLHVVAWIIFAGLGIEAGGFLVNTISTLLLTPEGAKRLWTQADLSELYHHNLSYYVTLTSLMCIAAILKAIMFYFIVRIFYDKQLNLSKPFNESIRRFLLTITYLAMGIGLFSLWGTKNTKMILGEGIKIPDLQSLRLAGGDVWLFMGVILLVIAQVFKKGIEIQKENELTV
ncbi:MAG: DUF2975 domain-containing protein [Chitinophagaceae bacterium]|nr:DUF2975 domain-containing protein [Chitinophagaceae bacterium]